MFNRKLLIAGAAILALAAGGTGIAVATGGGDDEGSQQPISGSALEKASAAALAETGGGQVTETEVGDEEGYYEVEVTRSDGSQVDVHLNRDFSVIDSSADGEGSDEDEAGDSR
jgi:uncharacterized membrane protein YkoI